MSADAIAETVAEFRPQCTPPSRNAKGGNGTGTDLESAEDALDAGRISRIIEDTEKVSRVLSEVFAEDGGSPNGQASESREASPAPAALDGLDEAHSMLVWNLLERLSLSESEFSKLASDFGLMPGGALESINEWSFERFGDALLVDDSELTVNNEVLRELRSESGAASNAAA